MSITNVEKQRVNIPLVPLCKYNVVKAAFKAAGIVPH